MIGREVDVGQRICEQSVSDGRVHSDNDVGAITCILTPVNSTLINTSGSCVR
ncbi:hypothetical protein Smp_184860 [Schistosoma mansoni]|uniref:hypothetical protein n=1 Tax=Schistosoma mansoni TaxID=6183 RepID=UPI00022DC2C8|nr:hypothetical protein Smp_184860 [Schistosoma mansoni]|eukprot:XP_018651715.1 hypothetical protein Smp_184860 [Schistosoma mansoni]